MENNSYQNPPQDNYYQNLYNMFGGYNPVLDKEARNIRRLGMFAGGACVAYIVLQNIFVILMSVAGYLDTYQNDATTQNFINILFHFFCLFTPFLFVYVKSTSEEKKKITAFEKPNDKKMLILAVFAGLAVCLCSNFIGNFILGIFSTFGVEFSSGMENAPQANSALAYISAIFSYAVIPALVEEFAFRGVVLQPLRKYGDKFAIVISSVIFALMHGNMVQAPIAFVAGLALGYFCIITESIWTSIAIHFANNLFSTLSTFYFDKHPEESMTVGNVLYYIILISVIVIGIFAALAFRKMNNRKLTKVTSELGAKFEASLYLCSPAVVLSIVYSIYATLSLQKTSSFLGVLLLIAIVIAITVLIVKKINVIKKDSRLNLSGSYSASKVFIIIAAIALSFLVITLFLYNGVAVINE